ncbi:hypothetical protein M3Y97_01045300 [Aphelenchoides bicaudatus]|nr:hypothetical protein M3Y97_01045300 [Aphelenchoides bicaudatus]
MRQEPIQVEEQQIVSGRQEVESDVSLTRSQPEQQVEAIFGRKDGTHQNEAELESASQISQQNEERIETGSQISHQNEVEIETGSQISHQNEVEIETGSQISQQSQQVETASNLSGSHPGQQVEIVLSESPLEEKIGSQISQQKTASNVSLAGSQISHPDQQESQQIEAASNVSLAGSQISHPDQQIEGTKSENPEIQQQFETRSQISQPDQQRRQIVNPTNNNLNKLKKPGARPRPPPAAKPLVGSQISHPDQQESISHQIEAASNVSLAGSQVSQQSQPDQQKTFETESEVESRVIESQYEPPITDTLIHEKTVAEKTETGSNESLDGSIQQRGSERIVEETGQQLQQESPFEEEIEILDKDEFLGDYGSQEAPVPSHETTTITTDQHEDVERHEETSHQKQSPDRLEESFDLLPDAEEIIEIETTEKTNEQLGANQQQKASGTPHSTPAIEIYPYEEESSQLPEEELTKKLSDVYSTEEAERIAREAVEHGTIESQQLISSDQKGFEQREGESDLPAEPLRHDYSRVLQEEYGRSESAGTELDKDREFTREDFGDDVPDELQRVESVDSEKPTVELFSESGKPIAELPSAESHVQISKSPDDELADFQIIEKEDVEEEIVGSGGLGIEEPTIRPHSPVPPRWQSTQQSVDAGTSSAAEMVDSGASSTGGALSQKSEGVPLRKSDDESSLQEFERLELEATKQPHGSPVSIDEEAAEMVASATGSLNSLAEFENVEREIMEEQMAAAGGPEVMILSDIREESEVEEMSIHEDDDNPDSLNEAQERLAGQEMLTSVDSLEPGTAHSRHHPMDTSVDSLEPTVLPGHADDSLLEGASHQENPSQDTQAMLSNDTAATFQEYHEDDRDSLEGVIGDYPTTLTTYETVQSRDDGTTETITRRVLTRITDPVHTHVVFSGTENEDRLRNIQPEERVESVDEEGNITTTIRRQTPTN